MSKNRGWNDAVRGMMRAASNGNLNAHIAKVSKAMENVKTEYSNGVREAIAAWLTSQKIPEGNKSEMMVA